MNLQTTEGAKEFVRVARKELGLTQQELAEELKVTRRTIVYWESPDDHRTPTGSAMKLLKFLLVNNTSN